MKLNLCVLILLLFSCTPSPSVIEYGEDMCDFCKMSIVDPQFACELVSNKGKVFKYDAIECMVRQIVESENAKFSLLLVNHYENPNELVDSRESFFLISKDLPSPMGGFLSAYADKISATKMMQSKGGKVYSWEDLLTYYKNKSMKS